MTPGLDVQLVLPDFHRYSISPQTLLKTGILGIMHGIQLPRNRKSWRLVKHYYGLLNKKVVTVTHRDEATDWVSFPNCSRRKCDVKSH